MLSVCFRVSSAIVVICTVLLGYFRIVQAPIRPPSGGGGGSEGTTEKKTPKLFLGDHFGKIHSLIWFVFFVALLLNLCCGILISINRDRLEQKVLEVIKALQEKEERVQQTGKRALEMANELVGGKPLPKDDGKISMPPGEATGVLTITEPTGGMIGDETVFVGTCSNPRKTKTVWLVIRERRSSLFIVSQPIPVKPDGTWTGTILVGREDLDAGRVYEILAVADPIDPDTLHVADILGAWPETRLRSDVVTVTRR